MLAKRCWCRILMAEHVHCFSGGNTGLPAKPS
jgi:hypothetical protein